MKRLTCVLTSITFLCLLIIAPLDSHAQELVPEDTLSGWDVNWIAGLNGSQSAYSNWSRGGVNNLSVVGSSELIALYRQNSFSYGFRLRTQYGQSRIQDEGTRKTDDRISLRNRFLYDLGGEDDLDFSLYANINFETQFGNGFDYGAGEDDSDVLISRFMAPAYFTQNVGIAYIPDDSFSIETGIGLKQTIVRDTELSTRYGLDPGDQFFNEAGFTFGMNYEQEIFENVAYSGYVETFSNLNRSLSRTDVYWSNQLVGRINSFLNMTFRFELMYDDDFSEEVQISQVLSAGISIILY